LYRSPDPNGQGEFARELLVEVEILFASHQDSIAVNLVSGVLREKTTS
jgi:hypothetical protein